MKNIKARYDADGAVWPLPVFTAEEITRYRAELEKELAAGLMASDYRCKSQVLFPWLAEIAMHPKITEYVSTVLGTPNIHCWDTLFWVKQPKDEKFVSFHQDATYWNFFPTRDACTVWLAFNDVTELSGAIQYALGTHLSSQLDHADVKSEQNLLMRGQTVSANISPAGLTIAEVPAGSVTIHSPYIIHGSQANRADAPRLACGMIFAAGTVKPVATYAPESTLWVAGVDEHGHMLHDPVPTGKWQDNVTAWRSAYDRQHENYYKMTVNAAKAP